MNFDFPESVLVLTPVRILSGSITTQVFSSFQLPTSCSKGLVKSECNHRKVQLAQSLVCRTCFEAQ